MKTNNTTKETRELRLVPDNKPKLLCKQYHEQAKRDWLMTELAIQNLANHLPMEASANLLDALYMCPAWMQSD